MSQVFLDNQAIAQLELAEYITNAVICPQEDLLDRAFDELTPSEWERLKQYQPEIESDRPDIDAIAFQETEKFTA